MELCQDLKFASGTTEEIRVSVINQSSGLPVPIGDIMDATWGLTPFEEETTPLVSKALGSGITVPEDGVVLIKLNASDTLDLSGEFTHELRLKDAGNSIYSATRGRVTILYKAANNPV